MAYRHAPQMKQVSIEANGEIIKAIAPHRGKKRPSVKRKARRKFGKRVHPLWQARLFCFIGTKAARRGD